MATRKHFTLLSQEYSMKFGDDDINNRLVKLV